MLETDDSNKFIEKKHKGYKFIIPSTYASKHANASTYENLKDAHSQTTNVFEITVGEQIPVDYLS